MKPVHASKTVWLNVATGVALFVSFLLPQLEILPIPDAVRPWLTFGIGCINAVANIVVRLHTHQPLEGTVGAVKAQRLQ